MKNDKRSASLTTTPNAGFARQSQGHSLEIPEISLSKGGGALRGIDETFTANPANGTATLSVPLPLSPGRNGFAPTLSLHYDSGAGNSPYGLGWDIGLGAIQRKTGQVLPHYGTRPEAPDDIFLFAGAEDLVPLRDEVDGQWIPRITETADFIVAAYRPVIESAFDRIERITRKADGAVYWKQTTRENVATFFGYSASARIAHPENPDRVFAWLPEWAYDDKGSWVCYEYVSEDLEGVLPALHEQHRLSRQAPVSNRYLKRIKYGNELPWYADAPYDPQFPDASAAWFFELVVDYGDHDPEAPTPDADITWPQRPDPFSDYRAGFEIRTWRRCHRFLMFHRFAELGAEPCLVQALELQFDDAEALPETELAEVSCLRTITHRGYVRLPDGSYSTDAWPPLELQYEALNRDTQIHTVSSEALPNAPAGLRPPYHWVDLYNEGIAGLLSEQGAGWTYQHNLGNPDGNGLKFGPARQVLARPSLSGLGQGMLRLQDLEANGERQVVVQQDGLQGYYEIEASTEAMGRFRPFAQYTTVDLKDPNLRLLDVTGDGRADLVLTEDHVLTWYPAGGKQGFLAGEHAPAFAGEAEGPALVFADTDRQEAVLLADMSGDGLTDVLRIRNGEIVYWPNLGYGRFGDKVAMSNAPRFDTVDRFDPRRLRLAEVSGTGARDLVYIGAEEIRIYINLSGNAWGAAFAISAAFPEHALAGVSIADLLGNGTACIVWSSQAPADVDAPLKYIDLMGGRKPYLLTGAVNHRGKSVQLSYRSSTWYYLRDKAAGRPWKTRLPFPVYVLAQVTVEEQLSGLRFSTSYDYRHGYYDPVDRAFRGFGLVEQRDTEHFDEWIANSAGTRMSQEVASYQPPVLTRTWFHTGAPIFESSNGYAEEYWPARYAAAHPDHPIVVNEPSPPAWRLETPGLPGKAMGEALRACKGAVLRTETFALDGDPADAASMRRQAKPQLVALHNCRVQCLQPGNDTEKAVFLVTEYENFSLQYERNETDPRIAHSLNVLVDEFGNTLESAAIAYPRQQVDPGLPQAVRDVQARTLIRYTQHSYTNDVLTPGAYRMRRIAETRDFEITSLAPAQTWYDIGDFTDVLGAATEVVPYHEIAQGPGPQRRLLEQVRHHFLQDDLATPLPLGMQDARGMADRSYVLAFTPELLTEVYADRITDAAALMTEGGYAMIDGNWWIPSGQYRFFDAAAGENHMAAADRFFLPVTHVDATGAETVMTWEPNRLLYMLTVTDPLGNASQVEAFNWRLLQPRRTRDLNDNLSAVCHDELGRVKAQAVLGKGAEADSLLGHTEHTPDAERDLIQQYLAAGTTADLQAIGAQLLQQASVRYVYDFSCYQASLVDRTAQEIAAPETPPCALVALQPTVSASIQREEHHAQNPNSALQLEFAYYDGWGQPLLTKSQAAPGLAMEATVQPDCDYVIAEVDTRSTGELRWIANGRTIRNNKGNPVRQYPAWFSTRPQFEDVRELVESGVSPVSHYDALGRNVRTDMPDGTFVLMEFDGWSERRYDANDTVLDSQWFLDRGSPAPEGPLPPDPEGQAAWKAAQHQDTPSVLHFDTLGRPIYSLEHNRSEVGEAFSGTITIVDIEGHASSMVDARGNVMATYQYDLYGRRLAETAMDSGSAFGLPNVHGNPIRQWDSRAHVIRHVYDLLQRRTETYVQEGAAPEMLTGKNIYGEALIDAAVQNLRGELFRGYDGAGLVETVSMDHNGQVLERTRQLAAEYRATVDWSVLAGISDPDAAALAAAPLLEAETFSNSVSYDALGRVLTAEAPDGSLITHLYDASGGLDQVEVHLPGEMSPRTMIAGIDYNAFGKRERIRYVMETGDEVTTRYEYHPENFRLTRLHTVRHADGAQLQDLNYTYDPVGNVTHIRDDAQQTVIFANILVTPEQDYTYDARYRLIQATGREHAAQNNLQRDHDGFVPVTTVPFPNSPEALQRYVRAYSYDVVGNLTSMHHTGGNVQRWTRRYAYNATNNRLTGTSLPGDAEGQFSATYSYDAHGNLTAMPHLPLMRWNHRDQLVATSRQVVNSGTPETSYYVYNAEGERIRKVTDRQAAEGVTPTRRRERIYLGGFEIFREYENDGTTLALERNSLHVADDQARIAQIDRRTFGADPAPGLSIRFRLQNHLGSATMVIDAAGSLVSYEEYHPYGTSAFRSGRSMAEVNLSRYRYIGREYDEESGLNYHGLRYYAPWLARWTAADPIGLGDGPNRYMYVRGRPLRLVDPGGTEGEPPSDDEKEKKPKKRKKDPFVKKKRRQARRKRWGQAAGLGARIGTAQPDVDTVQETPVETDSERPTDREKPGQTDQRKQARQISAEEQKAKVGKDPRMKNPQTFQGDTHLNRQTPFDNGSLQVWEGATVDGKEGSYLMDVPDGEGPPKKRATFPKPLVPPDRAARAVAESPWGKLMRVASEGGGKLVPGVGDGWGIAMGLNALRRGQIIGGLLDIGGAIPVVGMFIDVGVTAYEITRVVDEWTGFTDWMVGWPDEVEALPPAYRRTVSERGMPHLKKPKPKPKPRAKPKPRRKPKPKPPEVHYFFSDDHVKGYAPRWELIS